MEEVWKDAEGYEVKYRASNFGKVIKSDDSTERSYLVHTTTHGKFRCAILHNPKKVQGIHILVLSMNTHLKYIRDTYNIMNVGDFIL